jgi:hypothetical protein
MGIKNGTVALWGAANTDITKFDGGVMPGVKSNDPLGTAPISFAVQSLGATSYSLTAVSMVANQASGTLEDALQARNALAQVIKELIRKGILEGSYTI